MEGDEVFFFFRGKTGDVIARQKSRLDFLVRENVELLLRLALHVFRTGLAENVVHQPGAVNIAVQHLCGEADGGEDAAQFALGLRVFGLTHDDEFTQTLHKNSQIFTKIHIQAL